jgi:hypothetical protein
LQQLMATCSLLSKVQKTAAQSISRLLFNNSCGV